MTRTLQFLGVLAVLVILSASFAYFFSSHQQFGSATPGTAATIASSTNPTVSSTAAIIIATSTCTARIISTGSNGIMLTFSDYNNATPSGSFGNWQAASTTVVYDATQYGCGLVKAYSSATQTITVTDVR